MDLNGQACYLKGNLLHIASRALGIEHTPFEAYFGLSPKEHLDLLFNMRPSIPVSQDASARLRLLHEIHALAHSVLQLQRDEMQARSKPSTVPHFVRGDNVKVVTTNLFLRGQTNMKLHYRHLGPFTLEEQIGKTHVHTKAASDSTLT
jgi:hypothetical protein